MNLTPEVDKRKTGSPKADEENFDVARWYSSLASESNKLFDQPHEVCVSRQTWRDDCKGGGLGLGILSTETAGFDVSFWKVTVPCLLRQKAPVWYANLAIHALIDARRPNREDDGGAPACVSYRRALRYHGLALAQLRKEVVSCGNLQSATLCCLFFVIFEMMSGDEKAAQAHMYNGYKMMNELKRNSQGQSLPCTKVEELLRIELQKALHFVASQVNGPSGHAEDVRHGAADGDIRGRQ
jgi:hypothetical protein